MREPDYQSDDDATAADSWSDPDMETVPMAPLPTAAPPSQAGPAPGAGPAPRVRAGLLTARHGSLTGSRMGSKYEAGGWPVFGRKF